MVPARSRVELAQMEDHSKKCTMKEYGISPTNFQVTLVLSLVQNAPEGRKIIIFDIPGTYLNADMIFVNLEDDF